MQALNDNLAATQHLLTVFNLTATMSPFSETTALPQNLRSPLAGTGRSPLAGTGRDTLQRGRHAMERTSSVHALLERTNAALGKTANMRRTSSRIIPERVSVCCW